MFDNYINEKKDEMVSSLSKAISFPSISIETSSPSEPFGKPCKEVLDYILNLGNYLGFRTKNIDDYCGYIEFGSGNELVGILGHLDVVPADDNWSFPPFEATIKDGKLYGRGSIDDKGPVISSLYAMKAVMDTCKVSKRVRLILGLNEEKNWKCIKYYKEHEEAPTIGFSPDADFPCIYAEKGLLSVILKQQISNSDIKIKEINTNNNAINVVPKYCKVLLEISSIDISSILKFINSTIDENKFNIKCSSFNNSIILESYGIAAHAAHPDLGVNAISNILVLLQKLYSNYNISFPIIEFFNNYINTEYDGQSLGISSVDESGALTLNVGTLCIDNNIISIGLNLRIPVTVSSNDISSSLSNIVTNNFNNSFQIEFTGQNPSLYIDKNDTLVKTLCNIFNETTNSNKEPIAIGGATYARAFNNCISFGANFPGDLDMCHQIDEFIYIDKFILSSKIYAKAIYELAK